MDNAAMRGLFGRLGLSPQAAHFMVHDQSINSLTILKRLTDDSIKELCRVCRKPGGMIVHPNAGAPVAGGAAGAVYPAMYPNPGIAIAALHADNIKLASFYIRTCANVSRTCAFADVTLGSIETMRDYKIEIEAQVNLKISEAPKINANKVFEFFTEFGEFTLDMVGSVSKIPLSYVYRENEGPLPEALEPTFGTVGSTFASFNHELVARAPIFLPGTTTYTHYYTLDRVVIWKILYEICYGTPYYTYIKAHQQSRDGRAAYFALYTALLGTQAVANYASKAENKLQTMTLDGGNKRNWGFEKYVLAHMDQHTILEHLKVMSNHRGIDETSKIRLFSLGITDPGLDTVKATVSANPALDTFDKVVGTYRTFIESKKQHTKEQKSNVNVSSATSSRNGGGNRTRQGDKTGGEEDGYDPTANYDSSKIDNGRYYTTVEWNGLKKNQRNYLRKNSRRNTKKGSPHKANVSQVKTAVMKNKKTLSKMKSKIEQLVSESAMVEHLSDTDDDMLIDDTDSDDGPVKKKKSKKSSSLKVPRKKR